MLGKEPCVRSLRPRNVDRQSDLFDTSVATGAAADVLNVMRSLRDAVALRRIPAGRQARDGA